MLDNHDITPAVVSRICHDLIGHVSAISIGIEAFELSGDQMMLKSISDSSAKASWFLSMMRMMFSQSVAMNANEIIHIVKSFLEGYKIYANVSVGHYQLDNDVGKLFIYSAYMIKSILPKGGSVSIDVGMPDSVLSANMAGQFIVQDKLLDFSELNSRNIFDFLLFDLAKKNGFSLKLNTTDNSAFLMIK